MCSMNLFFHGDTVTELLSLTPTLLQFLQPCVYLSMDSALLVSWRLRQESTRCHIYPTWSCQLAKAIAEGFILLTKPQGVACLHSFGLTETEGILSQPVPTFKKGQWLIDIAGDKSIRHQMPMLQELMSQSGNQEQQRFTILRVLASIDTTDVDKPVWWSKRKWESTRLTGESTPPFLEWLVLTRRSSFWGFVSHCPYQKETFILDWQNNWLIISMIIEISGQGPNDRQTQSSCFRNLILIRLTIQSPLINSCLVSLQRNDTKQTIQSICCRDVVRVVMHWQPLSVASANKNLEPWQENKCGFATSQAKFAWASTLPLIIPTWWHFPVVLNEPFTTTE